MKQILLITAGSASANLLKQALTIRDTEVLLFHHEELQDIDRCQPVVIVIASDEHWAVESLGHVFATIQAQHPDVPKIWMCETERVPILSKLHRDGSIVALINFDQGNAFSALSKQIAAYL